VCSPSPSLLDEHEYEDDAEELNDGGAPEFGRESSDDENCTDKSIGTGIKYFTKYLNQLN